MIYLSLSLQIIEDFSSLYVYICGNFQGWPDLNHDLN